MGAVQAFQELLALTTRPVQSDAGRQCDSIWGQDRLFWKLHRIGNSKNARV